MSNTIIKFKYREGEIATSPNGESLKILHCLVPLSKERGEPVYLVNYKNKVQTMTEDVLLSNII